MSGRRPGQRKRPITGNHRLHDQGSPPPPLPRTQFMVRIAQSEGGKLTSQLIKRERPSTQDRDKPGQAKNYCLSPTHSEDKNYPGPGYIEVDVASMLDEKSSLIETAAVEDRAIDENMPLFKNAVVDPSILDQELAFIETADEALHETDFVGNNSAAVDEIINVTDPMKKTDEEVNLNETDSVENNTAVVEEIINVTDEETILNETDSVENNTAVVVEIINVTDKEIILNETDSVEKTTAVVEEILHVTDFRRMTDDGEETLTETDSVENNTAVEEEILNVTDPKKKTDDEEKILNETDSVENNTAEKEEILNVTDQAVFEENKTSDKEETLNETASDLVDFDSDDSVKDPDYKPSEDEKNLCKARRKLVFFGEQRMQPKAIKEVVQTSPLKIGGKKRKRVNRQAESKKRRNLGLAYVSLYNKACHPERLMGPPCGGCKWKCSEKISESQRQEIFLKYWELGNIDNQREFIVRNITECKPAYRFTTKEQPRNFNFEYTFMIESKAVRVCKNFFTNTLGITHRVIRTCKAKLHENGFMSPDKRGKHKNHPALEKERKQAVQFFIDSIPRTESHYLRAQTSREYIDGSRSLSQIYRDYVENEKKKGKYPVSEASFKRVFYTDFNISFFIPKKDQCTLCESFKNAPDNDSVINEYEKHLYEKELSRMSKSIDKLTAEESPETIVCAFDLQAVLPCPTGFTSTFYYKRKVSCYNFTITNIVTKETVCYFWHEGEAKRGANEIGSCIYLYLKKVCSENSTKNGIDVVFYCDNCGGQNKNRFIDSMFLYAVQKLPQLSTVRLNFLVCGHTQNEGDMVHSIIEKAVNRYKKCQPVFTPVTYTDIIRSAKQNEPRLEVVEMYHKDFYDLKKLQNEIGTNFDRSVNGDQYPISSVRQIMFQKTHPFSFFAKRSFEDDDWAEIYVKKRSSRGSAKKLKEEDEADDLLLHVLYEKPMQIPTEKRKDIMDLISANQIPKGHAAFYENLFQKQN